jgi:hypothetical protein
MILATGCFAVSCLAAVSAAPTAREMVAALAADAMRGRGTGSAELDSAGALVQEWLGAAGAGPGADGSWRQEFAGASGEPLFNVVGRIEGRGEEWIALGAHYDGLGVGLPGTDHAGEVFNGADDNAAGVAALVLAARRIAAAGELARSVVLVGFSGEESGLLGSRAFVASPPAPLERCRAMLNLDTVGRIEDGRVVVFGTASAEEFPEILKGVNFAFGFDLAFHGEGLAASDHTPFLESGIPALHFFSGAKPEYHGPGDDLELLDLEGIDRLAEFVAETAVHLAAEETPLTFRPPAVERAVAAAPGTQKRRVSFGSIPDFARESGGVLLSGVMPGSPAEEAGLAKGDVVIELGGAVIDTIDDFQAALVARQPGDVVLVKYRRGDETLAVEVTLRERSR